MKRILVLSSLLFGLSFTAPANADKHHIMTIYKNPYCGCCTGWAEAMSKAGYSVKTIDLEDISHIKKQSSVTTELAACHTAIFGDYIIEGHVPLEAIEKLMSEKPDIRGIAVPGMPQGSLGMGYDPKAKFNVFAFSQDLKQKPTLFYQAGK